MNPRIIVDTFNVRYYLKEGDNIFLTENTLSLFRPYEKNKYIYEKHDYVYNRVAGEIGFNETISAFLRTFALDEINEFYLHFYHVESNGIVENSTLPSDFVLCYAKVAKSDTPRTRNIYPPTWKFVYNSYKFITPMTEILENQQPFPIPMAIGNPRAPNPGNALNGIIQDRNEPGVEAFHPEPSRLPANFNSNRAGNQSYAINSERSRGLSAFRPAPFSARREITPILDDYIITSSFAAKGNHFFTIKECADMAEKTSRFASQFPIRINTIQLNQLDQLNQLNQLNQFNQINQLNQLNQLTQLTQLTQLSQLSQVRRLNQNQINLLNRQQLNLLNQLSQLNRTNRTNQTNRTNRINQRNQTRNPNINLDLNLPPLPPPVPIGPQARQQNGPIPFQILNPRPLVLNRDNGRLVTINDLPNIRASATQTQNQIRQQPNTQNGNGQADSITVDDTSETMEMDD